MLANEDRKRGKERGKGKRGREGVSENFWFKKSDIINSCSKPVYRYRYRYRSAIFQTRIWTGSMSAPILLLIPTNFPTRF